jgi:DNA-binding CsgD family transcriptional regulator
MNHQTELARIEAKIDVLIATLLGEKKVARDEQGSGLATNASEAAQAFFRQFTTKQNAALQMLLRGASNAEVAERLGVTENTAKVHVRSIAKKLGVHNRGVIALRTMPHWQAIGDEAYRMLSGGLPRDWDANYAEPDPLAHLYVGGKHETGEEE